MVTKRLNIFCRILGTVILLGFLLPTLVPAQETDPFYRRQLSLGERYFLAQDFNLALKHLEIAAFGLTRERDLRAKAFIYMSLCHFQLNDIEKCELQLRKAAEVMGDDGIASLNLLPAVAEDVDALLIRFGLSQPSAPAKEKDQSLSDAVPEQSLQEDISAEEDRIKEEHIQELKTSLKENPSEKQIYIDLFNAYVDHNQQKQGKRILKKLIKQFPSDFEGLYLLARTSFKEKRFPETIKYLERILRSIEYSETNYDLIYNAKALVILSSYYKGDKKKISVHAEDWKDVLIKNIDGLDLQKSEKAILLDVLKDLSQEIEEDIP